MTIKTSTGSTPDSAQDIFRGDLKNEAFQDAYVELKLGTAMMICMHLNFGCENNGLDYLHDIELRLASVI